MSFTNYAENKILDHLFKKAVWTPPDTILVGLHTASPGETGSFTNEVSSLLTGYSRVVTSPGDWSVSADGVIYNTGVVSFDEATDNWGTVTHFSMISSYAFVILIYGALATSRTILTGSVPRFDVGTLGVTLN